jgi:hypothetical protein
VAIVGVPNKLDPFLRPLMVHLLNRGGWYGYGMEKSFTPRELRDLLESCGLRVQALTGILFIPGWLRMLDLLCHTRWPRLDPFTAPLVAPFAWLFRHVPAVRRHGYMIACVVEKPAVRPAAQPSPRVTERTVTRPALSSSDSRSDQGQAARGRQQ